MADWTKSMQQTFEFYEVDPITWKDVRQLTNVTACTINRDSEVETLGSATFDITESVGECYIRVYLITNQNGIKEKHPLGTYLVQTPSSKFDGKIRSVSMDAYTPLLELKEKQPPIGFYVPATSNVMSEVCLQTSKQTRAPIVKTTHSKLLFNDFVADTEDTWLSFLSDLMSNAKHKFDLDEMGRVLFAPIQDTESLQPVWTYDDGNSSILYPELIMNHDLYGIPNVIEVIYTNADLRAMSSEDYYVKVVNDDPNSPTSIINRGREITKRITDPAFTGIPSKVEIEEYAKQLLKEASAIEYTITYTHGYCPARVGDCVRLNYNRAGLKNIKAKIISQSIKCEPGCPVTEKAVFTTNLWG